MQFREEIHVFINQTLCYPVAVLDDVLQQAVRYGGPGRSIQRHVLLLLKVAPLSGHFWNYKTNVVTLVSN